MAGYDDPFGAFGRIALYLIAFLMIYALRSLAPNRKIPLLTTLGKNSLWIFILHRPLTLWLSARMEPLSNAPMILLSVLCAIVLCLLLGNDVLAKFANRFLEGGAEIFTARDSTKLTAAKAASLGVALWFIVSVVLSSYKGISFEDLQKLMPYSQKTALNEEYTDALKDYCTAHSYGYINANTYIRKILSVTPDRTYLLDHIHPNATKGVVMYSEAVLSE